MFQFRKKSPQTDFFSGRFSKLRLPIAKHTVGILEGQHPSLFKGIGHDFEDFKYYQPTDDVRNIDWKSSARNGVPVIKRFRANSNTNLVFLIDSGRQMLARTQSGERKIEVLENICNTFGYLSAKRMDGVGIVAGDSERIMNERTRLGTPKVHVLLDKVAKISDELSPESSYDRVLSYANSFFQKRTFFVLLFDETQFYQNYHDKIVLIRRLKERHDLFAVSMRNVNPFNSAPPEIEGKTIDIISHAFIPAYFRSQELQSIVKKEMTRQRGIIRDNFKELGVPLVCAGGTEDFHSKLSRILQRREVAKYR